MEKSQYLEMFYAEAYQNHEELERLFTVLEKNKSDTESLEAIFRIMHTMKGNALSLDLNAIAELAHVLEDVFGYVKENNIELTKSFFDNLFRANDTLGSLIESIKSEEKVQYKGITAKIKIALKRLREKNDEAGKKKSSKVNKNTPSPTGGTEPAVELVEQEEESSPADPSDSKTETKSTINFSDQIQIPVRKLDALLNLMGELIIEKDTVITQGKNNGDRKSRNLYSRLDRITSDMQYAVMNIRMIQVGVLFNKFHRVVRDVSEVEGKEVDFILKGTEIEIDRNILKSISDSLVHLVRNAIGHGIETREERKKAGKPETGRLTLNARNEKDSIYIEVSDDGKGIDTEVIRKKAVEKQIITKEYARSLTSEDALYLIFEPGFSNAEKVTEISGRGVGMDVVKRSTESIGGKIEVETKKGEGTTFTLQLPSTMAVKGALLFEQGGQEYAVPLSYTEAVVSIYPNEIHKLRRGLMADYQGHTMLLVFAKDLFSLDHLGAFRENGQMTNAFDQLSGKHEKLNVVVVKSKGKYVGIVVDRLLQQKEIVEKTLSSPLDQLELFSGATLLGNGNVCLVINTAAVMERLFKEYNGMKSGRIKSNRENPVLN